MDFQNEVVFNGIPMAQPETQGFQTIWNPPFESLPQFNVLRSSFSAQYGLAQGVVTYQTKSGTNSLHGDGFEIIRNNFFDAEGAYNPTTPIDKENNYGFAVGGPVTIPHLYGTGKNKTFFYLAMRMVPGEQYPDWFLLATYSGRKSGRLQRAHKFRWIADAGLQSGRQRLHGGWQYTGHAVPGEHHTGGVL